MSIRNVVLVCDGARAWMIDAKSGGGPPTDDGVALEALPSKVGRRRPARALLLPPAAAAVWIEAEDVAPGVLARAPLPFLAPYVPAEYIERYHAELWKHHATDRGTLRAAYLLLDKAAVDTVTRAAPGVRFVTPWEVLASGWGEGTYRVEGTVYRISTDENGAVTDTRTAPADAVPEDWGAPMNVPLADLARKALGLPGRTVGRKRSVVSGARWLLAAGVLALGLALLHTGGKARALAERAASELADSEAAWSGWATGRGCEPKDLIHAVRRAIVAPEKSRATVESTLSLLEAALGHANPSVAAEKISVRPGSAYVRFGDSPSDVDAAALRRSGLREERERTYVLEVREGR